MNYRDLESIGGKINKIYFDKLGTYLLLKELINNKRGNKRWVLKVYKYPI